MGFHWTYDKSRRDDYRNYIQHLLAELEQPMLKEKEIARSLAGFVKGTFSPFIGIAGIPAAGKSTICENLVKVLKEEHDIKAIVIPMDGYHYYRKELDEMENPKLAHERRGAEFTFNGKKFVEDVTSAK